MNNFFHNFRSLISTNVDLVTTFPPTTTSTRLTSKPTKLKPTRTTMKMTRSIRTELSFCSRQCPPLKKPGKIFGRISFNQKVENYRLAKRIFNSKCISNLIKLSFSLPGPFPTGLSQIISAARLVYFVALVNSLENLWPNNYYFYNFSKST